MFWEQNRCRITSDILRIGHSIAIVLHYEIRLKFRRFYQEAVCDVIQMLEMCVVLGVICWCDIFVCDSGGSLLKSPLRLSVRPLSKDYYVSIASNV